MANTFSIYVITNALNGLKYVGRTVGDVSTRFKNHLNCAKRGINCRLYKAIRDFGSDSFTVRVIDSASNFYDLVKKEAYWIKNLNTFRFGYNSSPNADGGIAPGHRLSRETKLKMSISHRGKVFSEEHRKHISESAKKRGVSEEFRIRARTLRVGKTPWHAGTKGVKLHSEETKRKMSENRKGRPGPTKGIKWSPDVVEKRASKLRGRPSRLIGIKLSKEHRRRISEGLRKYLSQRGPIKLSEGHKSRISEGRRRQIVRSLKSGEFIEQGTSFK
jgi:group I intron endonuclease